MPQKYIRKSTRQSWDEENMRKAIEDVKSGKCGYLKASQIYHVPKSTLARRCNNKNKVSLGSQKGLGNWQLTFPPELEEQLVNCVREMERLFFGLTDNDVRSLAYQLAEKNNLHHRFNSNKQLAGHDWLRNFSKRNKLSLRVQGLIPGTPTPSREYVNAFFTSLEAIQENYKLPASRIFSVNEIVISNVKGRPSTVLATYSKKEARTSRSEEEGALYTVEICMSASGTFLPPMIVLPRVPMDSQSLNGAPLDILVTCHPSGRMQIDLFAEWFNHFLRRTEACHDNPVLLILDGRAAYTKNMSVIESARENSVKVLCLPRNIAHRLQPVDVAITRPLNAYYDQEVEKWLRDHPQDVVTAYQVCKLFDAAFLRAATPPTAVEGFAKCGIYPVNREVFQDSDFAATESADTTVCEYFFRDKADPSDSALGISAGEATRKVEEPSPSTSEDLANIMGIVKRSSCTFTEKWMPYQRTVTLRKSNQRLDDSAVLSSGPCTMELMDDIMEETVENIKMEVRLDIDKGVPHHSTVIASNEFEYIKVKAEPTSGDEGNDQFNDILTIKDEDIDIPKHRHSSPFQSTDPSDNINIPYQINEVAGSSLPSPRRTVASSSVEHATKSLNLVDKELQESKLLSLNVRQNISKPMISSMKSPQQNLKACTVQLVERTKLVKELALAVADHLNSLSYKPSVQEWEDIISRNLR